MRRGSDFFGYLLLKEVLKKKSLRFRWVNKLYVYLSKIEYGPRHHPVVLCVYSVTDRYPSSLDYYPCVHVLFNYV